VRRAVLFDLDGTLADTAPDLARALNRLRAERGLDAVPPALTRPHTSSGARGLLRIGMDMEPDHADYPTLRERFLDLYAQELCVETRLFDGTQSLLAQLEEHGIRWGVVTNKARRLAEPLLERLGLAARVACVVGGDSTGKLKPHPDSLLFAAAALRLAPSECLYVGDDLRDVQAARAAGMGVIVAAWGYLGDAGDPATWNADAVIDQPLDALKFL